MVTIWASTQPFAHNARSSIAKVGTRRGVRFADNSNTGEKKPLYYSPWNTSCIFWFNGRLFVYRCYQKDTGFYRPEEVSISCILGSQSRLRDLLAECRVAYLHLIRNKTSIFEHQDDNWESTNTRGTRPISTVIMNEKNKHTLLKDVQEFLDEGACEWYSSRGIPYRKGLLFYGPPGTGKSSFSFSLAGHFDLDIYVLNLPGVTDGSLTKLFKRLPQRCAVLLEDIDSTDTSRSRATPAEDTAQVVEDPTKITRPEGLSLSGLLNAIDGVSSHEGRVLIMTTNHIERLDPALIRAGRMDRKVEFPHASRDVVTRIFCMIFEQATANVPNAEKPTAAEGTVKRLANEFAAKVPEGEYSPAEIQSFLLENRHSASEAVQNVEEWMTRVREERTKVKRANSWVVNG